VVPEPLGGAHRAPDVAAGQLKKAIEEGLKLVAGLEPEALLARRQARIRAYGKFKEAS